LRSTVISAALLTIFIALPTLLTPRTAVISVAPAARVHDAINGEAINGHPVVLDNANQLLSWSDQNTAYSHVMQLAWDFIKNKVPDTDAGVKSYLSPNVRLF